MEESFDYVIVGAGSAGCAIAGRLSEDPGATVLVLEAGGKDRSPNIKLPAAFSKQFRTRLDWGHSTGPEPHLDDRELYVPRGKALGGSGSMNAMMWVRGRPLDYDGWRQAGCWGWGYDDVLPYFKRLESYEDGGSEWHGSDGPVNVTKHVPSPRPLTRRFIEAAQRAGIPVNPDINSPEQDGVAMTPVTQRNGRRWSTADGYLRPAMKRANLAVKTGAQALGIELVDGRASAVRWRDSRGREHSTRASREIVLSAGAIGSPQLLMLSGVGPSEHLRELGIEPRVDSPGVGENLQDHPFFLLCFESTVNEDLADAEKPKALLEFLLRRTGPLTSNVGEATAFVRTRPGLPAADVQFAFGPVYYHDHGFDSFDGHAFSLAAALITPRSRGRLRLRSADPDAKPRLLGNHLSEPEDVASLVAGFKQLEEIANTAPLDEVRGRRLVPDAELRSDEEIEAFLRRETELLYHPAGTCRMGGDEGAVVDPELRVRGVEGLRVADAAVMPVITGGNTHAPTVMIGEKAADLIRGGGAG
ncbi:MAG TPA: GMC family oxidoreductase N-terminal domain-containing protein [Solirubrobacterales bacterium]|nr:GMC family oxidoreductase N-terminal domain-containing protein [Solirubrobacterales bacterium]